MSGNAMPFLLKNAARNPAPPPQWKQGWQHALNTLLHHAKTLGAPCDALAQARQGDVFFLLEWGIPRRQTPPTPKQPSTKVEALIQSAAECLRWQVLGHPCWFGQQAAPIVFGTGGHRGQLGVGLGLVHVHAIVQAWVDTLCAMPKAERTAHYGAAELGILKQQGVVLGHDNRLCNPEFSFYAAYLLQQQGFKVRYAGRIASPELSLLTPHFGWTAAFNFTPSHNPFRYGGIKLNPFDGGLADETLTEPLATRANVILQGLTQNTWPDAQCIEERIETGRMAAAPIEVHDAYLDLLEQHPMLKLGDLIKTLRQLSPKKVRFVVDPVWGAATPVYLRLQKRLGPLMHVLHTEDDPFFGGQTTEPNESTLKEVLGALKINTPQIAVGVRNDPDGDRGLVCDAQGPIKMNAFAPLVYHWLMQQGHQGGLCTTYPTSHKGPHLAQQLGQPCQLTATGFKHFRRHLKSGNTLLAYEESDGMSIQGHTLDKDGILAGLLALRMSVVENRSLNDQLNRLNRLQNTSYYWRQETFAVNVSAQEIRQHFAALRSIQVGDVWSLAGKPQKIVQVLFEDGCKIIFESGLWVMMRPSGTEPKVRIYAESMHDMNEAKALCMMGQQQARAAMSP